MINGLFNQTNYQAAKKLMDVSVLRHEAIASNLSNIETPGYKRLDVNTAFEGQLSKAIESGQVNQLKSLNPSLAEDPNAVAKKLDGNSVDLEEEIVHMNENAMNNKLQAQLISGTLSKLRLAITGRPS